MSGTASPYRILTTPDGAVVPWYLVPFDEAGRCRAPETRAHLLAALERGDFTHVFLFSHGWNNDWKAAVESYEAFVTGFAGTRAAHGIAAAYRPLLVGVFWPSISLLLPSEQAPQFAGGGPVPAAAADALAGERDRAISDLAAALPPGSVERFYALADRDGIDEAEARELADLLMPLMAAGDEGGGAPADAADVAAGWRAGAAELGAPGPAAELDEEDFGTATPIAGGAPEAAGWLGYLDPRWAVRMATVWRMKDRAGTVGANGVHALLAEVLDRSDASVHLIGHSYGGKVVLSALAAGPLSRKLTSVLLLQPAISHLCFATDADGAGTPGGFRGVLDRVRQPVLTTFSSRDVPLYRVFHLAVRRKSDLGEQKIAGRPPSRFAALGGYGPRDLAAGELAETAVRADGDPYPELDAAGVRVVALDGSLTIGGHSDVIRPETWWMLCEQVARS